MKSPSPTETRRAVSVIAPNGKSAAGTIVVLSWAPQARTRRAIRILAFFWVGALFSVILPLLHFVLVPALFLAGPVAAWWVHQQDSQISGGEGECPQCGKSFPIAGHRTAAEFDELCNYCQCAVKIRVCQSESAV